MQRPRDSTRELFVVEHPGFEFEHQQQDDPGERVDRRGIGLDDVEQADAVRELQFGGRMLLEKKHENVQRE